MNPQLNWSLLKEFQFTNGQDVDRTVWQSPQWTANNNASFLGQTSIRNVPDFGAPLGNVPVFANAAHLYLSTFNPLTAGTPNPDFLGAQISTISQWGLDSYPNGVAFEAGVVLPMTGSNGAPQGVVASLFAYNLISQTPFLHDEIDFEIASNCWQGSAEQINTNVYVVTDGSMENYDEVVNTQQGLSGLTALRIEWTPFGVAWFINKEVNPIPIYRETNVPQTDMSLVLNFWVPNSSWSWAYNSSLQPSNAPGELWSYQIKWARVWQRNED